MRYPQSQLRDLAKLVEVVKSAAPAVRKTTVKFTEFIHQDLSQHWSFKLPTQLPLISPSSFIMTRGNAGHSKWPTQLPLSSPSSLIKTCDSTGYRIHPVPSRPVIHSITVDSDSQISIKRNSRIEQEDDATTTKCVYRYIYIYM